jgi:hypothetical protein
MSWTKFRHVNKSVFIFIFVTIVSLLLLEAVSRTISLISDNPTLKAFTRVQHYRWPYSTQGWVLRDALSWKDASLTEEASMYKRHPTRGWTTKPNLSVWVEGYQYRTNSFGHRSLQEPNMNKPRVMLLGDSQTYGEEVDDFCVFSNIVQKRKDNFSILNLGVGGYGFDQMFITFNEEYNKWNPEYVMFFVTDDDFNRLGYQYRQAPKPFFRMGSDTKDMSKFDLIQDPPNNAIVDEVKSSMRYHLRFFSIANLLFNLYDGSSDRNQRWPENEIKIRKMMHAVMEKTKGASRVGLVYLSYNQGPREMESNSPQFKLFSKMCSELAPHGLLCADTINRRKELAGFKTTGHYGRLGNEVAADVLETLLSR